LSLPRAGQLNRVNACEIVEAIMQEFETEDEGNIGPCIRRRDRLRVAFAFAFSSRILQSPPQFH
jgi:hypothetical protein